MLGNILGVDQRVTFFRELATLVNSGVSIGEALSILQTRPGSPELRAAINDAAKRVSHGERFSEVMAKHPKVFSALNLAMIAAGERGGRLDAMLNEVADYLEKEQELRRMLSRETFYPKILVGAAIFIPLIAQMVIAGVMIGVGAAIVVGLKALAGYLVFFLVIAALWFAYRKYRETDQGAQNIDRAKLSLPVLGAVISQLAWAKICRAIGALYKAGLTTAQALELAGPASGNRALQATLTKAIPHVQRGVPLSEALTKGGYIPDLPLRMLQTGEKTGDIDATMEKVAEHFEAQSRTSIQRMAILIVPIAVVIMGVVVLLMAASAYGGYFNSLLESQ